MPFPRTLSTEAFKSCRFTSPGNQLSSSGRCRLAISLWRNQNGRKGTQRSDYRGFLFWFWFVWILLLLQGLIQSPWKSDWNACCSFGSLRHLSDDVGRFWVSSRMCFPNDRNILSDTLISSLYKQTCLSLTHLYLCSTYRFGVFFFFFALRNNMLLDTFPGGKWTPTYTQSYPANLYLVEFIILSMLLWTLCMGCSSNPKIVKNFFLSHIVFYLLWLWKQKKRINAIMQVD